MITMPPASELLAAATDPSPENLWRARGALLAAGQPTAAPALEVLDAFHAFLVRWRASSAGARHSERASRLDLAALGGLASEELLAAEDGRELAGRLLGAVLTEGLAYAATRQHVRAWRGEVGALLEETAWCLARLLWEWSVRRRPGLDPAQRAALVERLCAPVRAPEVDPAARSLTATRLFQVILLEEAAAGNATPGRSARASANREGRG